VSIFFRQSSSDRMRIRLWQLSDYVPVQRINGELVWQVDWQPQRPFRFEVVGAASFVRAVYFGNIRLHHQGDHWFSLPEACWLLESPQLRSKQVSFIIGRRRKRWHVRVKARPPSGSPPASKAQVGFNRLIDAVGFLDACQQRLQYFPDGSNAQLFYWSAKRAGVEGELLPVLDYIERNPLKRTRADYRVLQYCVAYACYAHASGHFRAARHAFERLRSELKRGEALWPLDSRKTDGVNAEDLHTDAKYMWWIVEVKLWVLELDELLLKSDRKGVRIAITELLELVVRNEKRIRPYHISWVVQEVYSALPVFPPGDRGIVMIVWFIEKKWGPMLRMLRSTPWASEDPHEWRPPGRDNRYDCNRVIAGRPVCAEDLAAVKRDCEPNDATSRQNRLLNQIAWAWLTGAKDFSFLAKFITIADEARIHLFIRPLVLMFSLIQEKYARAPPKTSNAEEVLFGIPDEFKLAVKNFMVGLRSWFIAHDPFLDDAVGDSRFSQNMANEDNLARLAEERCHSSVLLESVVPTTLV